ncbi:helix-turn-helix domain-containing protein [Streptomyces sp. NBC_01803]|uniref:helix-turn-helix domain-containing protein n=1 Tax=Streptomyces sp. NBC_01803 TaxID=2975946 RepID=UPI002DD88248|nr:helix-turn-helix transcriptional regulator [Streptomyces sp. NBC_01803]WSA46190.1 helix-turn-helix domain-containing protein [Streptomyces sp. NBC_01803]
MNWSTQAIRDASRTGDYGRVVRLARLDARVSQKQLGEACGLSQSAVSRLEAHGTGSYDMTVLARAATHLHIPPRLLGLADHLASLPVLDGDVERRNFLATGAVIAAVPVFGSSTPGSHATDGQAATLRTATTAFRRLDGTTPSRHLIEPVLAHLRLTQKLASEAADDQHRGRLAAAGSEAASLAGWLSWDMGDHGSARTWYGSAITAARRSSDRLLAAYQLGSLAQLEAHVGNAPQSLALVRSARQQLGSERPAIADAWLLTIEALAHASAHAAPAADRALRAAWDAAASIHSEEPPPWPWVFAFNESKVAACRLSCGARLGLHEWVFSAQDAAAAALSSGHDKQRAQLVLDIAFGHLAAGRLDGAFTLGMRALETGLRYRSGRTVERARALRRAYTSPTPPRVVRDFDERLHGVYM